MGKNPLASCFGTFYVTYELLAYVPVFGHVMRI